MTSNQALTAAAVALAAFAAWNILRRPGATIAANAGQAQRDAELARWNLGVEWNWTTLAPTMGLSQNRLTSGL